MTIPSRPAPAPPMARGQSAAAGANASIEQLRLQLQQQQQQQQQNGGIQKLTIKLPPPPRGPNSILTNNNNINNLHNHNDSNSSSITRKFPQARYTPATDWDDSPFGQVSSAATTNGNAKKVPPPRPPPPKVQVSGRKANIVAAPPAQSTNILSNIFHRKKSTRSSSTGAASRVYSVSSGARTNSITTTTNTAATAANINSNLYNSNSHATANWNANWNSSFTSSSLTSLNVATPAAAHEAQLISFDSPPSSPTFTQKSNSDCLSVDSFSSDSNFSSPNNGSVSQPESGFEDDFSATAARSRPATTSPLDPWEAFDAFGTENSASLYGSAAAIGTAPVRNLNSINTRMQASNDNPLCNGKSLLPPAQSLAAPTIIKPKVSQKPRAPKPPLLPKPGFGVLQSHEPETPPSPPMPQCPPPPPPPTAVTLLDVISGKADALQLGSYIAEEEVRQPYGVALYDFDGVEEGDLSFRENEKIYLLEQVSAEWYRGRTRAGCEGIFPSNYVDVKVPLSAATATTASEPAPAPITTSKYQKQNGYSSSNSSSRGALRVRCLFNFPAEYDGDLALKENDMVTILYRINEDWLFGEIDGRQGQFPSNFLEYEPANIPMP